MPSRNRIENEKPNAIAGAAKPFSASTRSDATNPSRTSATSRRMSESGAPSRMSFRIAANLNSVSSTLFGSRRRIGISTNS